MVENREQDLQWQVSVLQLIDRGVHVVAAAGNTNNDAMHHSPARMPSVITVGASTFTNSRAWFSNKGPLVDVYAPGVFICSATSDTTVCKYFIYRSAGAEAELCQWSPERRPVHGRCLQFSHIFPYISSTMCLFTGHRVIGYRDPNWDIHGTYFLSFIMMIIYYLYFAFSPAHTSQASLLICWVSKKKMNVLLQKKCERLS